GNPRGTVARVRELSTASHGRRIPAQPAARAGLQPRAAQHAAVRQRFCRRSHDPHSAAVCGALYVARADDATARRDKLSETEKLREAGYDLSELARRGAEIYLAMIFTNGFYHADPHPGNLIVMPGNTIGLLDYGLVGRIDEALREDIEEMLVAVSNQDAQHLTSIIVRV